MRVAVCQMTSTPDAARNLSVAERLLREAAAAGARLACLPEYFSFYGPPAEWKRAAREVTPRAMEHMASLAAEFGLFVSLGSVLEDLPGSPKCANTSVVFDPSGREVARYRKIHLFDAALPGRTHRESDVLSPGDAPAVCRVDDWTVGLSICFDVRFPAHYQALRRMGAELLLVPSAFTAQTGPAHWAVLLRARAIETQSAVAAAAQAAPCHGHAMIVDAWGAVLADAADETERVVLADLDRAALHDVRRRIPTGGL